jgi:hypothetical protein
MINYLSAKATLASDGAVATGMTSVLWPTEQGTTKTVILGLGEPPQ